jgi:hypothetical protein
LIENLNFKFSKEIKIKKIKIIPLITVKINIYNSIEIKFMNIFIIIKNEKFSIKIIKFKNIVFFSIVKIKNNIIRKIIMLKIS